MSQRYKERLLNNNGISNKKFESELGIKLLEKMGWKQGNGLGKSQHGMTDCLQFKKREEGIGLGHTGVEQNDFKWNNNWWDNSFNNIANKVKIGANALQQDTTDDSESESEEITQVTRKVVIKKKDAKTGLTKDIIDQFVESTTSRSIHHHTNNNNKNNNKNKQVKQRKYSQLSCSSAGSEEKALLQQRLKQESKILKKNISKQKAKKN
ncbi:hypothetical protein PPERSA_07200 [Pseudocohnilembus persalinus]|uniref:G-patch domain-containing protein n=1 Tax=Pseudocohnilembus persalinus TaxID=266149 RepID=A0A0V0QCZ3_PSEPJ|nr:hypothetical protein PPERSA_07200 [Pseudocohnilembus persalinus]|eukprot:KRX00093.1 hypothetical protein PPERSA_07200 [Pseudocohnilembus persalinus]